MTYASKLPTRSAYYRKADLLTPFGEFTYALSDAFSDWVEEHDLQDDDHFGYYSDSDLYSWITEWRFQSDRVHEVHVYPHEYWKTVLGKKEFKQSLEEEPDITKWDEGKETDKNAV